MIASVRRNLLVAALLCSLVVAFAGPAFASGGNCIVRGDANCDGQINSVDATLVLQEVAGMIGEVKGGALADVNLDGARNSVDSALILQLDAGIIDCFGRCTYY